MKIFSGPMWSHASIMQSELNRHDDINALNPVNVSLHYAYSVLGLCVMAVYLFSRHW